MSLIDDIELFYKNPEGLGLNCKDCYFWNKDCPNATYNPDCELGLKLYEKFGLCFGNHIYKKYDGYIIEVNKNNFIKLKEYLFKNDFKLINSLHLVMSDIFYMFIIPSDKEFYITDDRFISSQLKSYYKRISFDEIKKLLHFKFGRSNTL